MTSHVYEANTSETSAKSTAVLALEICQVLMNLFEASEVIVKLLRLLKSSHGFNKANKVMVKHFAKEDCPHQFARSLTC